MFNACKNNSRRPSAPSVGVSPMASVGTAHSCPHAQSPATKLQIIPFEYEIVDAGMGDDAIEVQQPHVVAVGRGPTKLEVEHHVASGHAQHRTCCDESTWNRCKTPETGLWSRGRGPYLLRLTSAI